MRELVRCGRMGRVGVEGRSTYTSHTHNSVLTRPPIEGRSQLTALPYVKYA